MCRFLMQFTLELIYQIEFIENNKDHVDVAFIYIEDTFSLNVYLLPI